MGVLARVEYLVDYCCRAFAKCFLFTRDSYTICTIQI